MEGGTFIKSWERSYVELWEGRPFRWHLTHIWMSGTTVHEHWAWEYIDVPPPKISKKSAAKKATASKKTSKKP